MEFASVEMEERTNTLTRKQEAVVVMKVTS
jgi:hypothetical protein